MGGNVGNIGGRLTVDELYRGVRVASDGARWEGVAEVAGGRVVERGAWVWPDGRRVEGSMEMVWGQGEDAGVLTVVQPFASHEYLLVEAEEGGFVGRYECGDDRYFVWTEHWGAEGWKMRFEVTGPKKSGWQEVVYERQIAG